jgi:hypothetical protein
MEMKDAKATEPMASLGRDRAHDLHMLDHPWGSIRKKQVRVCLRNKHVVKNNVCSYIRS